MTVVLSKRRNTFALEMIDFQNNKFAVNIEAIVTKIKQRVDAQDVNNYIDWGNSKEIKDLVSLIYDRIGLKVNIVINEHLAAILPFYSNRNHIFIKDYFRGNFSIKDQTALLNKSGGKKGYVDIKNAKLSGIFSEYENTLYIHFLELFNFYKLTTSEVTAIILHELGHGFSTCEYSDRLETNNQIIANIAKELNPQNKKKDLTYVYTELKKLGKKDIEAETDKLNSDNRIIASVAWYRLIVDAASQSVTSQVQNAKYDETSSEQLADNFANRFGMGRELITALDKLHVSGFSTSKSNGAYIMANIMEMLWFGLVTWVAVSTVMVSIPFGIFMFVLMFFCFDGMGENSKDYTYDTLKIRYKRVRQDLVESLKNPSISKDRAKQIVESIHTVDLIMNNTSDKKTLMNLLSNLVLPGNYKANKAIAEQQLLEELSANELFVASATLRTL